MERLCVETEYPGAKFPGTEAVGVTLKANQRVHPTCRMLMIGEKWRNSSNKTPRPGLTEGVLFQAVRLTACRLRCKRTTERAI